MMTNLPAVDDRAAEPVPSPNTLRPHGASYERTIARFDAADVAGQYPPAYGNSFRERREVRCIQKSLQFVKPGGKVLDLPCGTGRLTPILAAAGFQVTAADASPHMLALAERRWKDQPGGMFPAAAPVAFHVQEVMQTSYNDGQFDGVVCNRLFHHFNEPETRFAALCELRRICRGTVVVSFFNSFAVDALKFRLKYFLRGTAPTDRIPIPLRMFQEEADRAGLQVVSRLAVMWGLSPLWYLVLRRK